MLNRLHASEGDKAVASRLYLNMIILFGLLEDFYCHCEHFRFAQCKLREAISLLGLLCRLAPRNDISVLSLLWALAHMLHAEKTDYLSHADTMQRAAGSSLSGLH
jgi:hypothetical protein